MLSIRRRPTAVEAIGAVFLLLTVWMLWLSAKGFWTYARLRNFEATVMRSSLSIDLQPADPSREMPEFLFYVLKLDLQAEDGSGRTMHWETDAGRAAYPEEALDELALWAAGTQHHPIQAVRGDARNLRIQGLDSIPELEQGVGGLIAAALFGVVALAMTAGPADANSWLARFKWHKKLGAWTVFFGIGMLPLVGSILFAVTYQKKLATWLEASAVRVETSHRFAVDTLPGNVQISKAARDKLAETSYALIEYEWNGHKVRGGMGPFGGIHEELTLDTDGRGRFRIDPHNRWELSGKLGWNQDFGVPFGALLVFGVGFCGAGLAIRKTENF